MIKIGCILVVLALSAGLLAGCTEPTNTTAKNDRETSVSGETKNTVNPDVSEPNQSIASGALIPDQTTTETTESATSNSNTYTVRGKSFTLSVHLEDYIYEIEGSDYTFFNLEEFMGHYGLENKSNEKYLEYHNVYGDGNVTLTFDRLNFADYNSLSGHGICSSIALNYQASCAGEIGAIKGADEDEIGSIDKVYEINGYREGEKVFSNWGLTFTQIVLLGVILDGYSQNGNTASVVEPIRKVFTITGGGDMRIIGI